MKKFLKSILTTITVAFLMGIVIIFQSCKENDNPAAVAQPSFNVNSTATVSIQESIDLAVTGISTPGGYKSMMATIISGDGDVLITAEPSSGATSGEATVEFTAGATSGVTVMEITITDNQNPSLSTTKSVTVTTSTLSLEDLTGIVPEATDEFDIEFGLKNTSDVIVLKGNINRDITIKKLDGYDWLFRGSIFVIGAEITIEPGVTVYYDAESASPSFLAIQRDASIMADGGEAAGRIIMTSSNDGLGNGSGPDGGDWGGLVLNGRAVINVGNEAEGEGGTGAYGGNNDSDGSGKLNYVVLKYAGRIIGVDNELNGFSFNGCGSGTQLSNLQSYFGEDDGFEWFGGSASIKRAVSTGSKDDSFDWTHGWRGNAQFLLAEQLSDRGDRGFEGDNLEADFTATPYSQPTISNVTLIGTAGNGEGTIGMRLRHGTKGAIHNALVTGFKSYGIRGDDDATTQTNIDDESLIVTHSISWKTNQDDATDGEFGKGGLIWQTDASYANSTDGSGVILDGGVGVITQGAVDPSTVYGIEFFESVEFIGAVPADDNWLTGWALKADGTSY
jgi:hypothetical protein